MSISGGGAIGAGAGVSGGAPRWREDGGPGGAGHNGRPGRAGHNGLAEAPASTGYQVQRCWVYWQLSRKSVPGSSSRS